ncbi:MAG TPA: hypothetical protein VFD71_15305 [Planctomycetota bacterium]|nr:hypothetical protein [Planctomycetota bacterium]
MTRPPRRLTCGGWFSWYFRVFPGSFLEEDPPQRPEFRALAKLVELEVKNLTFCIKVRTQTLRFIY